MEDIGALSDRIDREMIAYLTDAGWTQTDGLMFRDPKSGRRFPRAFADELQRMRDRAAEAPQPEDAGEAAGIGGSK